MVCGPPRSGAVLTHYRMLQRVRQPARVYGAPLADQARKSPAHVKGAATKAALKRARVLAAAEALRAEVEAHDPFKAWMAPFA